MTTVPAPADPFPQTKSALNRALRWFVLSGLIYFGLVAMFASLQRKLIYVPTRGPVSLQQVGKFQSQLTEVQVSSHDGLILHGWLAAPYQSSQPRKLVVLFPGNGGHRGHRAKLLEQLSELGWYSLLVDYRGYAENTGHPNETDFARDAHSVIRYATDTLKFPISDIVICGQSLGGGVATRVSAELCQQNQVPGGLILRATFTSLVDAGAHNFPLLPVRTLVVDRYPSIVSNL